MTEKEKEPTLGAAKQCSKCKDIKPIKEFRKRSDRKINRLRSWCKVCEEVYRRNRNAGIELDLTVLTGVDKVCRICNADYGLVIDHDHVTGRVRGYLCRSCNLGLGNFRDDTVLLYRAAEYLEAK